MCNRKLCIELVAKIFSKCRCRTSGKQIPSILVPIQRIDGNGDIYNLCINAIHGADPHCWINVAMHNLEKMYKIDLDVSKFEMHFKNTKGEFRYIVRHGSPVFIGRFSGLSRQPLNKKNG